MIVLLSSFIFFHLLNAIPINSKVQVDFASFNDDSRLELLRAKSFVKPDYTKYEAAMKKLAKLYRESQEKAKKCLQRTNKSWIFVVVDCTTARPEVTTSSGYSTSTQNPSTNSEFLDTTTAEYNEKLNNTTTVSGNTSPSDNQESHVRLSTQLLPQIVGDIEMMRAKKNDEVEMKEKEKKEEEQ